MITRNGARVHDLVRFSVPAADDRLPPWVLRDRESAWGVVRRQSARADGGAALGLRGRERSERVAVEVTTSDILEVVAPEELITRPLSGTVNPGLARALSVLSSVDPQKLGGLVWGPTGSAGFELATGIPAVRETSDLDMILRADRPVTREVAGRILHFLLTLPCRVDCLLEIGRGAVALAEWAAGDGGVLLRTPSGPVLTKNPWQDCAS
ncbi:malonate decarboxylase holo-ACP synthase [Frondihabitans sucicola]|uniref:malonate decarboxylase holo-ACP synthase n=1 Tax=Frondihabitans sucicola TaxID=1268041 RepID=UPI00257367A7|nr:malonate decarboxylase holo-ACP synthase [Frondihabitans sucicola]